MLARLAHPFNVQNRIYANGPDPWRMARESQQYRFSETNRIIREHFPGTRSILEFGSGEGHQTEWLLKIAPVHGVEISSIAVSRAKARYPKAAFSVGSILDFKPAHIFDLATGFECLWYVPKSEYKRQLDHLSECANNVIISYHHKASDGLDPLVLSIPDVGTEVIRFGDSTWRVAWWRGNPPHVSP
jgi:SAM-dependent methyltransferase